MNLTAGVHEVRHFVDLHVGLRTAPDTLLVVVHILVPSNRVGTAAGTEAIAKSSAVSTRVGEDVVLLVLEALVSALSIANRRRIVVRVLVVALAPLDSALFKHGVGSHLANAETVLVAEEVAVGVNVVGPLHLLGNRLGLRLRLAKHKLRNFSLLRS